MTNSKNIHRNAGLNTEGLLALGVGAIATHEWQGRWTAQLVVAPTFIVGSRHDFPSEGEAVAACRENAARLGY